MAFECINNTLHKIADVDLVCDIKQGWETYVASLWPETEMETQFSLSVALNPHYPHDNNGPVVAFPIKMKSDDVYEMQKVHAHMTP